LDAARIARCALILVNAGRAFMTAAELDLVMADECRAQSVQSGTVSKWRGEASGNLVGSSNW
jgi:hypothetical protein